MKSILSILIIASFSLNAFSQKAGSFDENFGNNGKIITSYSSNNDVAYSVKVLPDGKFLIAGYTDGAITGRDFLCIRYHSNGVIDSSFGKDGIVAKDIQLGSDDVAYSLDIQMDGKLVLAGYSDDGSNKNAAIVRLKPNGDFDSTFGNNGVVLTDFENSQADEITVVKIHHLTGKIVAGGATQLSTNKSKPAVARYFSNGEIDTTFNTNGIKLLWITSLDYQYLFAVEDLEVQSNGKISAVGWRDFPTMMASSDYWACRINNDGTMDNTFSTDGVNVYNGSFNGNDRALSMILNSNNEIIVAGGGCVGSIYTDFTMFKINQDGSTGSLFSSADFGVLKEDNVYQILETTDGKYILAGTTDSTSSSKFAISMVQSDGVIDNDFGSNGYLSFDFNSNQVNNSYAVALSKDGHIIMVGHSNMDVAIAKILSKDVPQLNKFSLLKPNNNDYHRDFSNLIFDWEDAFGADAYLLEIDTTQDFSGTPKKINLTSSTETINDLIPDKRYYWRVKAFNGANGGEYTDTWTFKTNSLDNFNHSKPDNNSTDQEFNSLKLNWTDVVGAKSYEVEIDSFSDFNSNPLNYTTTASDKTVSGLKPSTKYYWHVRAISGAYTGQWSDYWTFTTKKDQVSIDEASIHKLSIYPNPTDGDIVLECEMNLIGKEFLIYDSQGKVVKSGKIKNNQMFIDLNLLNPGVYNISIQREYNLRLMKL